jgi:amicyanin
MQKQEHSKLRRLFAGATFAVAAVAVATALAPSPVLAEEVTIKIDNFIYEPQTVTVKVGTVIKWVNNDDIPHNVVSSTRGVFKSTVMDTGQSYSFTVATAGTFEYFCALHPQMKGKIVVE